MVGPHADQDSQDDQGGGCLGSAAAGAGGPERQDDMDTSGWGFAAAGSGPRVLVWYVRGPMRGGRRVGGPLRVLGLQVLPIG